MNIYIYTSVSKTRFEIYHTALIDNYIQSGFVIVLQSNTPICPPFATIKGYCEAHKIV